MTNENPPTITVETDGIHIEVTDAQSAQAALPLIEGTLEYHLGSPISEGTTKKRRHAPVEVECQKCGHEWMYRGEKIRGCKCPSCGKYTGFEVDVEAVRRQRTEAGEE